MDLIKLIIDAKSISATCCLCLKLCDNGTSIYDNVDIQDASENFAIKISLIKVIEYLFPLHDLIFSKGCTDCVEDLKKIYCKFRLRDMKIENLSKAVDIINKKIPSKIPVSKKMIKIPFTDKQTIRKSIRNKPKRSKYSNTTTEEILDEHQYAIIQLNSYKNKLQTEICHICAKICRNSKALEAHLNIHKKRTCPHCEKVLKTNADYNKHVKTHTSNGKRKRKIKHYFCDICPYKTINRRDLQSHNYKVHLHIKPYQCEHCPKSFYKKSNLTEHSFTHDRCKRFICELCGRNFSLKRSLIQHQLMHEGKMDYKCKFCDRKFVSKSRINQHITRTHWNKCHNCLYCLKRFTLLKDKIRHLKRDHWEVFSVDNKSLFTDSV